MKKILVIIGLITLSIAAHAQTFYVKANATGSNNGTSWANAYTDLQSALEAAQATDGGQIWVAAGTYKPSRDENGNNSFPAYTGNTFRLRRKVSMYGGFVG